MTESDDLSEINPVDQILGPRTLELLNITDLGCITVINGWEQGGAETYVTDFLLDKDGEQRHLIAKACIKFGPREAMSEWLTRRSILSENGVIFPELLVVDGATIVEEYIPLEFKDAYARGDTPTRALLREKYIDTFKRICGAGFAPQSLHDVRSHGDNVVVIDVGEDVGGHTPINSCSLDIVIKAEQSFRTIISK